MTVYKKAVALWVLLLAGCATPPGHDEGRQQTTDSIQAELQQASAETSPQPVQPPAEVMNDLMPATGVSIPGLLPQKPEPARFDVSVANAPADVFFMSLVADTDINMVVHPSVSGHITLDLKNVTINEVMQLAREVYGYEYNETEHGYVVLPARIQSRIFPVNYLNIKRDGQSSMTVSSGQIATADSRNTNSDGSNASSPISSTTQSSSINTSSKTDFWAELGNTVRSIIGQGEGRSVVIDQQSGLVIVRAMPGELRDVEAYLKNAQENLQRQVILEAKIIEVQLSDGFQAGIDWAALAENASEALAAGQIGLQNGVTPLFSEDGLVQSSATLSSQGSDSFTNLFAIAGTADNFGALLHLLSSQGEVQVLSSPRVSTLNNQKAVIKVGSDEFFVTEVSSTTSAGTVSTITTPDITLTPFFSGIALDVTPQISQNKQVILHIHPSVSEVNDQTKNFSIGGQNQSLPLALSTVRESDSVVKARSGQVVVIGGLMQNRSANDDGEVPLLGRIPLLGNLFKQKRKQSTRSELVILLRPIVVGDNAAWTDYIRQSQQRIERLQQGRQTEETPAQQQEAQ